MYRLGIKISTCAPCPLARSLTVPERIWRKTRSACCAVYRAPDSLHSIPVMGPTQVSKLLPSSCTSQLLRIGSGMPLLMS
jgi:hypothetical protein